MSDAAKLTEDLPKQSFDLGSHQCKILCDAFGEKNVEEALIFITKACTPSGKRVIIRPTYEMVRGVLECVHGRPEVGAVFISQGQIVRRGNP